MACEKKEKKVKVRLTADAIKLLMGINKKSRNDILRKILQNTFLIPPEKNRKRNKGQLFTRLWLVLGGLVICGFGYMILDSIYEENISPKLVEFNIPENTASFLSFSWKIAIILVVISAMISLIETAQSPRNIGGWEGY